MRGRAGLHAHGDFAEAEHDGAEVNGDGIHPDGIHPGLQKSNTLADLLKGERKCWMQVTLYKWYQSTQVQSFVAFLILSNFCAECTQRQIDPDSRQFGTTWKYIEGFFSIMFLLELIVNMYGSWLRPFFRHAWNYFDMLVVSIGILVLLDTPLPGPLKLVRMLRAFRVFRLFGRIESLRKILVSLRKALPGVLNSFAIMFLVVCIYAVLAVDLFKGMFADCHNSDIPAAITPRGNCWGDEYYGNFFRSLYTLFQVLTGESWSEMAVRPYLFAESTQDSFKRDTFDTFITSAFFLSFICVNGIVLLNVVVAVLLDGMNSVDEEDKEDSKETRAREESGFQDSHAAIVPAPHWKKDVKDGSSLMAENASHGNGPSSDIAILRGEMASMQKQLNTIQADVRELVQALRGSGVDGDRAAIVCSSNGNGGNTPVPNGPASRVQCFVGLMS